MKFLIGTKQYMTQVFDESGRAIPATVIQAGPVSVLQVKTKERDGYSALQLGFGRKKKTSKALAGHMKVALKEASREEPFRYIREFRTEEDPELNPGEMFDVSVFEKGEEVTVSGVSKGKGFQGVVKRYGFKGGPRTHGQKHSEREPGSIGATGPQKVFKGTRMPGRMGGNRVTVKNLEVVYVEPDENLLYVKGAVPGRKGTLLEIRG